MNTARALALKTANSPTLLASTLGTLIAVLAIVLGAAFTEQLIDDLVILSVVLLLANVVYLQPDWAVALVERLVPDVFWHIPTSQRRAALTIDDVPLLDKPSSFEEILDVLQENKVTATFFIMSGFDLDPEKGGMEPEARRRCRSLLQRAAKEGHELGNHLQFDRPAIAMSPGEFDAAFLHCDGLLAELAGGEQAWRGRPRRWFRPASAMWNRHMLARARERGYTTVIANCYPHDVAKVTRHINPQYLKWRVRPGAVVVVHDRWHTAQTLREALPSIKAQGLQLGTLSELQASAVGGAAPEGRRVQ